jgi:signal transduction histidine kinase
LLVDDDEDDYFLTQDLLRDIPDSRFELVWISDPDVALEAICRKEFDLCLVDYRLGKTDGLSLLRTAIEQGCRVPIILLTGQGERVIDLHAMRAGAADFLEKSRLDAALLERSIRYSLQGQRHADELEHRVQERTAELALANQALQAEISDRIRAEETLRSLDRRKNEFLGTLGHELRNPLVPIRNALEVMRLCANDSEVLGSCRAMIERQVVQMVRLLNDLLDVARISRGAIQLKRERVEVWRIVANAVENCRPVMDRAGHNLTVEVPKEPIVLNADPVRITQVLQNLLDNAAKYTEPGGQVWLTVTQTNDHVYIQVKDTGFGISSEKLPQVFETFTEVGRSQDGTQHGLGVGLSIVRTLVELHGGQIDAASAGLGQGSEFTVKLPLEE